MIENHLMTFMLAIIAGSIGGIATRNTYFGVFAASSVIVFVAFRTGSPLMITIALLVLIPSALAIGGEVATESTHGGMN